MPNTPMRRPSLLLTCAWLSCALGGAPIYAAAATAGIHSESEDGERVKLLRTSLTDRGDGARAVECGDGTLWILESEPAG